MTSVDLKKTLMNHLFWDLKYPIVVDEHNFMDVFAIRRTGYSVEYEIKISKSDLLRETRLLKKEQPTQYSKDWMKWEKHTKYLNRKVDNGKLSEYSQYMIKVLGEKRPFIPNEFYFYVPDFLGEVAVKEVQHMPYGVVICGKSFNTYGREFSTDYHILKPATKLHTEKSSSELYREVAHSLTIRNRLMKPEVVSNS